MLIGELVQKSGFTHDTIRYYEKIGLLSLSKKARRENNYKEYTPQVVSRLNIIRQLKNIGYTLQEIQQVLLSHEYGNLNCETEKEQILSKVNTIDKQIEALLVIKSRLLETIADCPKNCRVIGILSDSMNNLV